MRSDNLVGTPEEFVKFIKSKTGIDIDVQRIETIAREGNLISDGKIDMYLMMAYMAMHVQ